MNYILQGWSMKITTDIIVYNHHDDDEKKHAEIGYRR